MKETILVGVYYFNKTPGGSVWLSIDFAAKILGECEEHFICGGLLKDCTLNAQHTQAHTQMKTGGFLNYPTFGFLPVNSTSLCCILR